MFCQARHDFFRELNDLPVQFFEIQILAIRKVGIRLEKNVYIDICLGLQINIIYNSSLLFIPRALRMESRDVTENYKFSHCLQNAFRIFSQILSVISFCSPILVLQNVCSLPEIRPKLHACHTRCPSCPGCTVRESAAHPKRSAFQS